MIPERMAAVLLTGCGGPGSLQYRTDVPVPQTGSGEVLVRGTAEHCWFDVTLAWTLDRTVQVMPLVRDLAPPIEQPCETYAQGRTAARRTGLTLAAVGHLLQGLTAGLSPEVTGDPVAEYSL
ncbi:hypothetical protein ACFMBG_19510 [Leisingera sp. D0M16]|uniref:hypothetical protein n=1 Tax=Leisingera coralii TaxID=3351347 RepID=UPI003B7A5080